MHQTFRFRNHAGYLGPSLSDLERTPRDDREIMSVADFTSPDPFPISSHLRQYTSPTTSSGTLDAVFYRPIMSPFPGQEPPLSTGAGLPFSRATDMDGISFTGGLINSGIGNIGSNGLSGSGHTFSRFELRNHAVNSVGFMNEHIHQNQSHVPTHSTDPRGPPFSPLMPGALVP